MELKWKQKWSENTNQKKNVIKWNKSQIQIPMSLELS